MSEMLWRRPSRGEIQRAATICHDQRDRRGGGSLLRLRVSGRKKTKNCDLNLRRRPSRSIGSQACAGASLDSDARWRRRTGCGGRGSSFRAARRAGRGPKPLGRLSPDARRSDRVGQRCCGSGGARCERGESRPGGMMREPHPRARSPLTSRLWRMFACWSPRPSAKLPGVDVATDRAGARIALCRAGGPAAFAMTQHIIIF